MIKKLMSLVCCLVPMGVRAAPVVLEPIGADPAVATTYDAWQGAISGGQSVVIAGGSGINAIGGTTTVGDEVAPGINVAANMIVGLDQNPGTADGTPVLGAVNNLYVLNTAANPFTIISAGDVSVGSMLQVLGNANLGVKASDSDSVAFDFNVGADGIKIGDANNDAALTLSDIDVLTVDGSVISYGNFDVDANAVSLGAVNVNSGTVDIVSDGAVSFGGVVSQSGAERIDISAETTIVSNGTIQNNAESMNLSGQGGISVAGNLENVSVAGAPAANMTVSGGDFTVSGTMKNDMAQGAGNATLIVNVDSWTIDTDTVSEYSFVNNGDLYATVSGATSMKYGMNLDGMAVDNVFSLDTGTLDLGTNAFNVFSNYLNSFNLAVRDGDISVSSILNGLNSDNVANESASMSLLAQNIETGNVRNQGGSMVIKAADLDTGDYDVVVPAASNSVGNIDISGQIVTVAGGDTSVIASGALSATGAVSNSGNTTLNGNSVTVASVSNSGTGANLTVSSLTATGGVVKVTGDITNSQGNTTVWAKDVSIDGAATNNSGVMTIRGSDSGGGAVSVGTLNVVGGIVNLDALAGDFEIDNALTVSGGALNLGADLRNLTVGGSAQIAGDFNASGTDTTVANNVNVAASGITPFVMQADAIIIGGDLNVIDANVVRNIQFDAPVINISGDANVENQGYLTLGTDATSYVRVAGDLTFNNGGVFETFANDLIVGALQGNSKIIAHGQNITAETGDIDVSGNLYFDAANDPAAPTTGLLVRDTTNLTMKTLGDGADISVGAVSVGAGNTLAFDAADSVSVNGVFANNGNTNVVAVGAVGIDGQVVNSGEFVANAAEIDVSGIDNTGTIDLSTNVGKIVTGDITTGGSLTVYAATNIVAGAVAQTGGVMDLDADSLTAQSLVVSGADGTQANIAANTVEIAGNAGVGADLVQGGTGGMMNLNVTNFAANNLTIGGDFIANSGDTTYDIGTRISIAGDINVDSSAVVAMGAGGRVLANDLINAGELGITAGQGIELDEIKNNSGQLSIDSGTGMLDFATLTMNGGNLVLGGAGMVMDGAISVGAKLYQNWGGTLADNDINIKSDNYVIATAGVDVDSIVQNGKLVINTSDVDVAGDIVANDLRFVANPNTNWMNVDVTNGGSVSGDVDFIGLEKMTIAGNYTFNDGSQINAAILPYATGANAADINYWATVSLADDETLGEITNAAGENVRALITVGGKFESDLNTLGTLSSAGQLGQPQIGIDIFDIIDQGTAIWFLHAEDGVSDLATKIRNLNVSFCNADGSLCYDYLTSLDANNGSDSDLPAYVSVRDVNDDGAADSLYIVFDPRFGGPVEVFKIQPIVAREPDYTTGEYVSAGALDDMIAGQLINKQFYNRTPIEVIPLVFDGTNLSTTANELYNRMEDYVLNRDGGALARFSRLFQVREIEQIAGVVSLNEHTTFRSFEDRMFDEFIWNRNRNLNKAWLDFDYGMFYQNIDDGKHTDGNRFAVAGGFDWQESNTLVLGLTGHVSRTTSKAHDAMDLSYTGHAEHGDVRIDVADTNIGLGGYLMKILGEKARLYGNAFLDLHVFDVDRNQNFVAKIDGDGTAFSLISEWGLMHDLLNQYVVGNVYARVGYNFGFNVKEKAAGDDYMRLESDGYFILTPGYSLIAQKRIYPSAWFQIRPYASIGVEYDVLGAPDFAKYRFAVADNFTKYDVDIDPLWANIGGGVELLSARGVQLGIDYRYQYNNQIQLHNIKVSGSYRF